MTEAAARAMTRLLLFVVVSAAAACAGNRTAQVFEDQPALVVPPVPPRSIEPQPVATPPPEPQLPEVVQMPPTPSKPNTRAANRTEPKPEQKPEAATPETAAPIGPTTPPTVPPLRTAATPSGPEASKVIRDTLQRTEGALSKVDYQQLSDEKKVNYNSAKDFIRQAEEALKKEDVTQAQNYATRAEIIVKQLQSGR